MSVPTLGPVPDVRDGGTVTVNIPEESAANKLRRSEQVKFKQSVLQPGTISMWTKYPA